MQPGVRWSTSLLCPLGLALHMIIYPFPEKHTVDKKGGLPISDILLIESM
jgi:hypothetical protein